MNASSLVSRTWLDGRARNRAVLDECRPGDLVTFVVIGTTWSVCGRFRIGTAWSVCGRFMGRVHRDSFYVEFTADGVRRRIVYTENDLSSGTLRRLTLPRVRAWRPTVEPAMASNPGGRR